MAKRFQQHQNNSNKTYFSQLALYKAFNKYGKENFVCEEIEEVPNELLDEREKYWIKYYNSYYKGYNSTIGGRAIALYEWDVEEIIAQYFILKSARKVAQVIGCDHSTIDKILNENHIPRFSSAQQQSHSIIFQKENEILKFETTTDAAKYFIENHISKSKSVKSLRMMITNYANQDKKLYGYEVYYESKR